MKVELEKMRKWQLHGHWSAWMTLTNLPELATCDDGDDKDEKKSEFKILKVKLKLGKSESDNYIFSMDDIDEFSKFGYSR